MFCLEKEKKFLVIICFFFSINFFQVNIRNFFFRKKNNSFRNYGSFISKTSGHNQRSVIMWLI